MRWEVVFMLVVALTLLAYWLWLVPQMFGRGSARDTRRSQIESGLIALALMSKGASVDDAWVGVNRNYRASPILRRGHLRRHLREVR